MAKKKPGPADTSQTALRIVEQLTGEKLSGGKMPAEETKPKNANYSKRGVERAKKLSPARRREIAKKAAASRWRRGRQ